MARRAYPRKPESEKRIPFTLSLSGDRLKRFREAAEVKEGGNLSNVQLKEIAENVALFAIDAYSGQSGSENEFPASCKIRL